MKKYQEEWFQDMLDDISDIEYKTMESDVYLDAERQLDEAKEELFKLIPDSEKEQANALYNQMEEYVLRMYNIILKNSVCAMKFGEIEF